MSVALQCREREGGLTDEPKHPFMHQKASKVAMPFVGVGRVLWGVGEARSGSRGSAAEPEKPRCYQCDRCHVVVENQVCWSEGKKGKDRNGKAMSHRRMR